MRDLIKNLNKKIIGLKVFPNVNNRENLQCYEFQCGNRNIFSWCQVFEGRIAGRET